MSNQNKPTVLAIVENPAILFTVQTVLEQNGFKVYPAKKGQAGYSMIQSYCPDVVLLDLKLSDISGYEILQKVRSYSNMKVIMLSADSTEEDVVKCFDAGADDFLKVPFAPGEMVKRVETAIRHDLPMFGRCRQHVLTLQDIVFDFARREIRKNGKTVNLTPSEYRLVKLLASNLDEVVPYQTMLQYFYGPNTSVNTRVLRVYMARIRKALEDDVEHPVVFRTVKGLGFYMATDGSTLFSREG